MMISRRKSVLQQRTEYLLSSMVQQLTSLQAQLEYLSKKPTNSLTLLEKDIRSLPADLKKLSELIAQWYNLEVLEQRLSGRILPAQSPRSSAIPATFLFPTVLRNAYSNSPQAESPKLFSAKTKPRSSAKTKRKRS